MKCRFNKFHAIAALLVVVSMPLPQLVADTGVYVRTSDHEASDPEFAIQELPLPSAPDIASPQASSLPEIPPDFSGSDFTSIVLEQRSSLDDIVSIVRDLAADARKRDPDLGSISFTVTLDASTTDTDADALKPIEVARVVQHDVKNTDVMVVEPAENFDLGLTRPTRRRFVEVAEAQTKKLSARISVFRMIANGVVVSMSIFLSKNPDFSAIGGGAAFSAIVGGTTAGLIGYQLHRRNTELLYEFDRRAIWDADGNLKKSKLLRWKIAYGVWRTMKHAFVIATYLTAVQVASTVALGLAEGDIIAANPYPDGLMGLLQTTYLSALLSASSFGRWKQNESRLVCDSLDRNEIVNYANYEVGYRVAKSIIVRSQFASLVLSVFSVVSESMSLRKSTIMISRAIMLGVGAAGWAYHAWRFGGIRDLPVVLKTKEQLSNKVSTFYEHCSAMFHRTTPEL